MIVIFNPTAGRRRTQALWDVLDILTSNGVKLDVRETRFRGHATQLAADAASTGAPLIVAAGGDGTVAEVAHGMSGSRAKLGIIPIGTANVLAHELNLPVRPIAIATALAFGRSRPLWPGKIESADTTRLFVQMVGIGFDGQVVHCVSPRMKRLLGRAAYVMQTMRNLRIYPFPPVFVRIDGLETQASSIIVSKGRFYGGPYLLAEDTCPGEPGFSVSLFDHGGAWATLKAGIALPLGLAPRIPGLRQVRAREIVVTGNTPIPVQADGDAAGYAPLRISDAVRPIEIVIG